MERSAAPVEPSGLSEAEVAARVQHGYNELPSSKGRSVFATALDVVREPMFLLLSRSNLTTEPSGTHRETNPHACIKASGL
jgi:magnesium-transporting ATPase (P-type)